MMGSISCESRPENATIVLDDIDTELQTPTSIGGLLPGYHSVKYKMDGHRTSAQTIIVRSSEVSSVSATLVDTTLWKVYAMEETGLPTNHFTAVLVDSRGIVWGGTYEDGLVRFENGTWTNYRVSNANISTDQITCLAEAHEGSIWIGGFNGLMQYAELSYFIKWNSHDSDIHNVFINDIAVSGTSVWFATDDGFCRVKMSVDQYFWMDITTSLNSDLPGEKVTEIEVDGVTKWAGTETRGLVKFSNAQHLRPENSTNGLFRNTISALEIDKVGAIWAGHSSRVQSTGGLSRYNGATWDNLSHLIHGEDVTVIFADSRNNKWVGTNRALYLIINSNITKVYEYETTGLELDNVQDISEDAEGNLWLATQRNGLIKVNTNRL